MDYSFLGLSTLMNIFWLLVGFVGVVYGLRYFDKSLGINFKSQVWDVIATNPLALALYHGLRLVAVAMLLSAAIK
jgi:hypothetical protein